MRPLWFHRFSQELELIDAKLAEATEEPVLIEVHREGNERQRNLAHINRIILYGWRFAEPPNMANLTAVNEFVSLEFINPGDSEFNLGKDCLIIEMPAGIKRHNLMDNSITKARDNGAVYIKCLRGGFTGLSNFIDSFAQRVIKDKTTHQEKS